jgi:hypothetical protein
MKQQYTKPILDVKAYAQFESVFTKCSKTPGEANCWKLDEENPGGNSSWSKHQILPYA